MVAKMPFWVNLGEKLKKLFAFLKSAPSNLSKVIVHVKQKNFEVRTKMPNLGTRYLKLAALNLSNCEVSSSKNK